MNLTINAQSTEDVIRARDMLFGGLDAKRPSAWETYGWPEHVTFAAMLRAYKRTGPGNAAVSRILAACWRTKPAIKRGEAEGETDADRLLKPFWGKLRAWDERNLVGRYAGLILRLADNLALSEPVVRASKLVDVVPVWEDQLKVTAWDMDTQSTRYAMPTMYQYRRRSIAAENDGQGRPDEWADVHWSRVLVWAEGSATGDMFDGVPWLEAGYNSLVNLEKIGGGSAESFLKNSARNVVVNFGPEADISQAVRSGNGDDAQDISVKQALNDQIRRLNRNQDAGMVTQGASVDTLRVDNMNPSFAWEIAASEFAAAVSLPMTVLFGQQTGRLASDEDLKSVNALASERQQNEITPRLDDLLLKLQQVGVLAPGEYTVEWPDVDAPTEMDMLDRAAKMVAIAKDAVSAGMSGVFSVAQVQEAAGFEPQELPDMTEGDALDGEEVDA